MRLVVHLGGIESYSLVTRQIAGLPSELPFHAQLHSQLPPLEIVIFPIEIISIYVACQSGA